jgi:outer membrane protein assembly factor BamB
MRVSGQNRLMPSRRTVIAAIALGVAGCSGGPGARSTTSATGTRPPTSTTTPSDTPPGTVSHDTGTPDASGEPPSGPAVRWSVDVDGPVTDQPVVDSGRLYVAGGQNDRAEPPSDRAHIGPESSQTLFAFDLDGTEQWRYEASAGVEQPTPTANGVAAVVGWNGGLTGLDQRVVRVADGALQWATEPVDDYLTILDSHDGTVFAGTSDDALGLSGEELFAVAPDGTENWRVDSGDARSGTVHEGTLFVPFADRQLAAFDTRDGSRRWTVPAGPVGGTVRVFEDTIYLDSEEQNASGDYPLIAVAASDGAERWRYTTDGGDEGPFVVTGATQQDGTVYATEYGGLLFAVDASDGTGLWRYETDGDTTSAPVVVGDTVYLESGHDTVHAVDAASGEGRWQHTVSGRLFGILANDETVLAAGDRNDGARYHAFAPDGDERWIFAHEGNVTQPALDGDRAYVGTEGGYVACLGP